MATEISKRDDNGLWRIGLTTYGGSSSKIVDQVQSAVELIFNPFYSYVDRELRTKETLISSADILNEIQSLVDTEAVINYPETHKLLLDTYGQLFTLTTKSIDTSWNEIGYKCRDIMIAFAKEVFNPTFVPDGQEIPKEDDASNKLKWTARHYLKAKDFGDRYRESIEKIIEANWRFISSLGHRQDTANEFDARLSVIYTYLTIWLIDNMITK